MTLMDDRTDDDVAELSNEEYVARRRSAAAAADEPRTDPDEVPHWDPVGFVNRLGGRPIAEAVQRLRTMTDDDLRALDEQLRIDEAAEREQLRRQNEWFRYAACVPPIYQAAALDQVRADQQQSADVARKWIDDESKLNLLLAGLPGRGKTHLAFATLNEIARASRDGATAKPVSVQAWRAVDLAERFRPEPRGAGVDEGRRRADDRHRASTADVLLIDDVTAKSASEGWVEALWGLVDDRVSHGRRTVVTFNAGDASSAVAALLASVGPATASRLKLRYRATIMHGPDLRELAHGGDVMDPTTWEFS